MVGVGTCATTWKALLEQELALCETLYTHLLSERAALEKYDIEQLYQSMELKKVALDQLEKIEQERQVRLSDQGFGLTAEGMIEALNQIDPQQDFGLLTLWSQCKEQLGRCTRENTVNGRLISVCQQSVQRTLSVLTGKDNEVSTYNADGQISS